MSYLMELTWPSINPVVGSLEELTYTVIPVLSGLPKT